MRTRLRLGAVTVVALGALLLATALASPAFAWDATVKVFTKCLPNGDVGVKYVVKAWEGGHAADVSATYSVNGEDEVDLEGGELDEEGKFAEHFVLDAGTTGEVTVYATVAWKDSDEVETPSDTADLPEDCKGEESTTSTTHEDTTTSSSIEDTTSTSEEETTTTEGEVTTTTSEEEETTTSEALGATSTTGGGALPFTGASSGPMLLAGLGLVGGGLLFLWSSRARNQTSR
jgi:hypothetical protein